MWIARFKLKDPEDIYSPLSERYRVEFFAVPQTHFHKNGKINLLVGGVLSGPDKNKKKFVIDLKKDGRVRKVEQHHDFILVHAQHPLSREERAEIKIFYNPQYVMVRPVHVSSDGWEHWEVACLDRDELNKLVQTTKKFYQGELFSMKQEKLKGISSLALVPELTEKQRDALSLAYKEGYYTYPRQLTIPELAKMVGRAYSTFQENLRRAENKIIEHFLKYR